MDVDDAEFQVLQLQPDDGRRVLRYRALTSGTAPIASGVAGTPCVPPLQQLGTGRIARSEFCCTQRKSTRVTECFEVGRRGRDRRVSRNGYEIVSTRLSPVKTAPATLP